MSQDVPYRDDSTYKLSLKMEFKVEPAPSNDRVDLVYKQTHNTEPQLYLKASLKLLKLIDGDYRLKVINNDGGMVISRKLKSPDTFLFKMGFASQMKEKKSPNVFTVQFFNKSKEVTGQIILEVNEGGDFIVNGKRFGKI